MPKEPGKMSKNTRKKKKIQQISADDPIPIVDDAGHKRYICTHCNDMQIDLTKARQHQSVCFDGAQYIVQTAIQGYRREAPKHFCCLFCTKWFPRFEKAVSHVRSSHRKYIDVKMGENGKLKSHEVNFVGQLQIFNNERKVDNNIFRSFGLLGKIVADIKEKNEKLSDEQKNLLKYFQRLSAKFEKQFANRKEFEELKIVVNEHSDQIEENMKNIAENKEEIRVTRDSLNTTNTAMAQLKDKVKHIEKALKVKRNIRNGTPLSVDTARGSRRRKAAPEAAAPMSKRRTTVNTPTTDQISASPKEILIDNCNTSSDALPYKLSSIEMLQTQHAMAQTKLYINKMFPGFADLNESLKIWAQFTIHFILNALETICLTSRSIDGGTFYFLQENSMLYKKITLNAVNCKKILELSRGQSAEFDENDKENLETINIVCAIWSDELYNVIMIDMYDYDIQGGNVFISWLKRNLDTMLWSYFKNISRYYICEPFYEYNIQSNMLQENNGTIIETNPQKFMEKPVTFTYQISANELESVKKYLNKSDQSLNCEYDGSAVYKIWFDLYIGFLLDILTKIYGLHLGLNNYPLQFNHLEQSKTYDLTGVIDVLYGRNGAKDFGNHTGIVHKERIKTLYSMENCQEEYSTQFRAIVNILVTKTDPKSVKISFFNLNTAKRGNPINQFLNVFKNRLPAYIDWYFQSFSDGHIILDELEFFKR